MVLQSRVNRRTFAGLLMACAIGSCGVTGAAFAANTTAGETGVTADSILLGQSAALSGPTAVLGKQMNAGARLYFDYINKQGGVFGRKIELKALDDMYEPEEAVKNTKKLIEEDRVFALFGYVGTPTSQAVMPLVNQARIPFFAPFTGAQSLRDPQSRYVFHVRAGYEEETAAIVRQIRTTGLKRIVVVFNDDAYGRAGLSGVEHAIKALPADSGVQLVAQESVIRNTVEIGDAMQTAMKAKPDAVVLISAYRTVGAFVKEALRRGYSGQFYNVSFVGTQALAKEVGPQGSGVIISQVMPHPGNATLPVVREYLRLLQAAGKQNDFDYASIEGFIAAKSFVEGLRRAGKDLTRERLVTALETMRNVDLGGYIVQFSPESHVGSKFVEMTIINSRGVVIR
ncbi:ABC-type branched-subunit amino acid transport system substrate-binding protein [Cupriavidus metallidurans]|jgi:ABC-type branched-subunit amino acid transport system substrate-binding protein|uniref:ABC-type branched-chain amino acid transport system, periplasmic component n=1 Tax=Cupriavidus metallidurans (strain ATCC 43123 / DSM 2839 / NBRC 102507 / CH34) TaxID=266264 RepID=Q1LIK1_CUPMC|nr:ABC transporter substrate-binding protein [Cupriavidus metallidurans]ABF10025.1 ABC-type branched-chain amino acid transport system, periplasmic component [Cupriavidus metallidurans CH34]MDE4919487.1 ABC transporter substrate-binding protein [Cupriavidus metallidurans]QGS29170.1 ABC transporter substrate-binding protein [Cupriavidus metallidurans]UBM10597.1 ABC transporter substrate-binding protein [Cupriavidus metallidurans]